MKIPHSLELADWVQGRAKAIASHIAAGNYSEAVGMVSADPWPDLGRVPLLVLAKALEYYTSGQVGPSVLPIPSAFVDRLQWSIRDERHSKRQQQLRAERADP